MNTELLVIGFVMLIAAIVAIVLFTVGEMKNKDTYSADGATGAEGTALANKSLAGRPQKSIFKDMFERMGLDPWVGHKDSLYAEGGGYSEFDVPYGKDEQLELSGSKDEEKIHGKDWEKATDEKLGKGKEFTKPYGMNKDKITKVPQRMHKKDPDVLVNTATRHPAEAGH